MAQRWPFEPHVQDLLELLVLGEYLEIERRSAGVRLTADHLASAVAEYGRNLVLPPSELSGLLDVVAHGSGAGWSVNVPLWTREEGRSDLTLEITVMTNPNGTYRIEVDNLHVI